MITGYRWGTIPMAQMAGYGGLLVVKVSITLPNNAQITFESEDPRVIPEMVARVLRDLPRDLILSAWPSIDSPEPPPVFAEGNGVSDIQVPGREGSDTNSQNIVEPGLTTEGALTSRQSPTVDNLIDQLGNDENPSLGKSTLVKGSSDATEGAFIEFCRSANPLGDMRRVVVIAEGASRYLGTDTVDVEELSKLFDLVAWPRPHNLTQTLRNAARSKFRWLERIPGRSGHYAVTDLGRSTAL